MGNEQDHVIRSAPPGEITSALDELDEFFYIVTANGDIRYWNDALSAVTGYSDDEIKSMDSTDFFTGDDQMRIDEALANALEGEGDRVEVTLHTKDGDRIPYEFSSVAFTTETETLVAGIGHEISQRQKREAQRQLYEQAFDSALAGIAIADLDGELLAVNSAFLDLWGYDDKADVLGRRVTEFWTHPDDAQQVAETVIETGVWDGKLDAVRQDGTTFSAHASASCVTDDADRPVAIMSSFVDITDRIARERELKHQNEQLNEFASVVSHDLRNPLNVASGRVELANEEFESAHLESAIEALERMEAIIEDTLVLAKEGQYTADQEWISIQDVARQCWEMVETADATLEITESFELSADPSRLQHVFENLFQNAVEHGDGESTIRIGLIDSSGFYVEDDGPGIPEDRKECVLEAGYTTEEEGTGFGLTIVNWIAQAHEWDIEVTKGVTGGARFNFTNVDIRHPE